MVFCMLSNIVVLVEQAKRTAPGDLVVRLERQVVVPVQGEEQVLLVSILHHLYNGINVISMYKLGSIHDTSMRMKMSTSQYGRVALTILYLHYSTLGLLRARL